MVEPISDQTDVRPGDTVWFAVHEASREAADAGLRSAGWVASVAEENDRRAGTESTGSAGSGDAHPPEA